MHYASNSNHDSLLRKPQPTVDSSLGVKLKLWAVATEEKAKEGQMGKTWGGTGQLQAWYMSGHNKQRVGRGGGGHSPASTTCVQLKEWGRVRVTAQIGT